MSESPLGKCLKFPYVDTQQIYSGHYVSSFGRIFQQTVKTELLSLNYFCSGPSVDLLSLEGMACVSAKSPSCTFISPFFSTLERQRFIYSFGTHELITGTEPSP